MSFFLSFSDLSMEAPRGWVFSLIFFLEFCPWVLVFSAGGVKKKACYLYLTHFRSTSVSITWPLHVLLSTVVLFVLFAASEFHACPAYSPPATMIFLLFLMFEGLLFALFTSIMFGTQVAAIWHDQTVLKHYEQVKPGFTSYQPQPSNSWAWSEIEGRWTKTRNSSKNRKSAKTFWSFINSNSNLKIWQAWKFWNLGKFWKFLKLWKFWYGNSRNSEKSEKFW